jgi:hypothetical protein
MPCIYFFVLNVSCVPSLLNRIEHSPHQPPEFKVEDSTFLVYTPVRSCPDTAIAVSDTCRKASANTLEIIQFESNLHRFQASTTQINHNVAPLSPQSQNQDGRERTPHHRQPFTTDQKKGWYSSQR